MRRIYAIRDRVANDLLTLQVYSLITCRTDQEAARYFADGIYDKSSLLNKHPADYELIHCGFVDDTGIITPLANPNIIITGDALIAVQAEQLEGDIPNNAHVKLA